MQESSAAPKRVLLAVWVRSHFREFFRIAAVLPGAGLQPVILFASGYTGLDEDMKACQSAGISCERAPRWLGRSHRLWSLARAPRFYRGLLSRWWPRCVVLGEDNVSYATGLLVRAAREFGAKSVVLPNTIPNVREPVETLSAHPKHHVRGLASSWVATRYPRWTCRHEDHSLLRLPPAAIVALEWLGGAPGNPWLLNSGGSDVIAVESNAMRAAYTAAGIQSSQIAVIGSPADDVLSGKLARIEEERRSLREKWRLNPARPIVLCAVPPDQFSKGRNAGGLGGFRDLLACLVRVLGNMAGCEILFTPHPRIAPEDAAFLKEQGARVLPGDTVEWVGLCDLYVASVSATIRWAIACGIPVVNYDLYRYRYADYASAPGVITVEEMADFEKATQRWATDESHRRVLQSSQRGVAADWGRLDGQSMARLLSLLQALASRPGESSP